MYREPRGLLRTEANSITVSLSHLYWMKSPHYREEIINYFKKQGYAEALRLPYDRCSDRLTVSRPTLEQQQHGWHEAVDVDRNIAEIPF
jgi:hypothetical protein